MKSGHYLRCVTDAATAEQWAQERASEAGWSDDEARSLALTVSKSAASIASRAYQRTEAQPIFLELDLDETGAAVSLHHEGSASASLCDCEATAVAEWRKSSIWSDAQLRTHAIRLGRR